MQPNSYGGMPPKDLFKKRDTKDGVIQSKNTNPIWKEKKKKIYFSFDLNDFCFLNSRCESSNST